MPITGLITGTAFSPGYMGSNYQEASLAGNPSQFWFFIRLEFTVAFYFALMAIFYSPAFNAAYKALLEYKDNNKLKANFIFFCVTPILMTIIIILCLFVFGS